VVLFPDYKCSLYRAATSLWTSYF